MFMRLPKILISEWEIRELIINIPLFRRAFHRRPRYRSAIRRTLPASLRQLQIEQDLHEHAR